MAAPEEPAGVDGKRMVDGKSFRLADEVRYVQRCAAKHDGRIITLAQLILFSTRTGDAWLLDPTDRLAARVARDGEPEPVHIEETDVAFAIDWKGTTASRVPHSSSSIAIPAKPEPSWDTRRINSNTSGKAEIS